MERSIISLCQLSAYTKVRHFQTQYAEYPEEILIGYLQKINLRVAAGCKQCNPEKDGGE